MLFWEVKVSLKCSGVYLEVVALWKPLILANVSLIVWCFSGIVLPVTWMNGIQNWYWVGRLIVCWVVDLIGCWLVVGETGG